MLKTFLIGILLGIAATAGLLYVLPEVDQHREVSLISVVPNGGNREVFRINIPVDRIMVGTAGQKAGLPAGIEWPLDSVMAGVSAELFKVRNERDVVVGIAARTVATEKDSDVIDWIIHLPARGSLFVNMDNGAQEGGHRIGRLRAGSAEFSTLTGFIDERWIPDTSGEKDAPEGRIELLATYVGTAEPLE